MTWRTFAGVAAAAVLVLGFALIGPAALPLEAQTAILAEGVVESTSGGFRFPDGSVQATSATAASAPVEDTGQQGCWNGSGGVIACSGTGQDGELQLGVDWPAPRFTDNGDGTVTDNLTELIWLKNAACFGLRSWEQALTDANGLLSGQCSLDDGSVAADWRLPNVKELLSLSDYGEWNPAVTLGHPFSGVSSNDYWSSTTSVGSPEFTFAVNMLNGSAVQVSKTIGNRRVWPIRGGQ